MQQIGFLCKSTINNSCIYIFIQKWNIEKSNSFNYEGKLGAIELQIEKFNQGKQINNNEPERIWMRNTVLQYNGGTKHETLKHRERQHTGAKTDRR